MIQQIWFTLWRLADGNNTKLLDFPHLNAESIVVDAGGYVGEWTENIIDRYACQVWVFEPQPRYAQVLQARFRDFPDVRVLDVALGPNNSRVRVSAGIGGRVGTKGFGVQQTDVLQALPARMDLLKLNVEGSEYAIIQRLHDTDRLKDIGGFLIQFHKGFGDYEQTRKTLEETHRILWRYPGVWEYWGKL